MKNKIVLYEVKHRTQIMYMVTMNKMMEWSWFKVPVKVLQNNDVSFLDTACCTCTKPNNKKVTENDAKINDCENDYKMK